MESRNFFHEYLVTWGKNEDTLTTSWKFYHEIFILEQNSRNHKSFCHKIWSYTVLWSAGYALQLESTSAVIKYVIAAMAT